MRSEDLFRLQHPAPVAVGTGLVALDIVINGWESESPVAWAGGSCGNVMSILAYLGWQCFPVARLGDNPPADFITRDLTRFGVRPDFLYREDKVQTPIVIERVLNERSGGRTHFFSFTCPNCRSSLPRHRSILKTNMQHVIQHIPRPSVFYFDRISCATIEMAQKYAMEGTLVVFEPSSIKNSRLFKEALHVSHVLKYSQERIRHATDVIRDTRPFLEVETLGAYGLRFRICSQKPWPANWGYMEAYKMDGLKDEAGCGDWCTAGIIHLLGQNGFKGLKQAGKERILEALSFGQALSALNCRFDGARGGMYSLHYLKFKEAVKDIIEGRELKIDIQESILEIGGDLLRPICPACHNFLKASEFKKIMTLAKGGAGHEKNTAAKTGS